VCVGVCVVLWVGVGVDVGAFVCHRFAKSLLLV